MVHCSAYQERCCFTTPPLYVEEEEQLDQPDHAVIFQWYVTSVLMIRVGCLCCETCNTDKNIHARVTLGDHFLLRLNTITSMIKTNFFVLRFDWFD